MKSKFQAFLKKPKRKKVKDKKSEAEGTEAQKRPDKQKTKPKRTRENIEKMSKEAKEILKDPELFKKIVEIELDKKIVGEVESRKVIILCACGGRLVKNSQIASFNIMVNDDAGVGKDYVAGATLELMPKQYYVKKTRISPTVLNYWHNAKDEPQWSWDGKVLYLEDISESILNHDVFKVMCSSGSSATIVKDQKVLDLEIKGKPVMIVTTASATPNPELTRRFVILNLDSSTDQTKEIMKRHSEFRKKGIVPEVDPKYRNAIQFLDRVSVKITFADLIDKHFPANNIIMRTHYPRFLDFISASASLHQFQRKKDGDFILAEGQDYNIARECFLKLCSNKYMIPLTINQKKILNKFEQEPELEGTITQLHSYGMNFLSDRALSYNLNLLSTYGILKSYESLNAQNKTVEIFKLAKNYKPNEKIIIPTYKELCSIASVPSEPSTPSSTSEPSLPNNNNNNNNNNNKEKDFLDKDENNSEVAKEPKVAKGYLGVSDSINKEELDKIAEDFKE